MEGARARFVPPPADESLAAWSEGRRDGRSNKPQDRHRYGDKTLQAVYRNGYHHGMQEALQADFGDPLTTWPRQAPA